ncbi:MAG: YggS family pyridoxal phosphate-dependent enzyme [Desulfuromonadaceae bacterium]|nr:YggS family pyridoxal phosphate-dependent enzyme [Desulfuromonadaceae bacterium]
METSTEEMSVAQRLDNIRQRMDAACVRSGRNPADVELIAVSKKKSARTINAAAQAGQRLFGESYVQEFCDKRPEVTVQVSWHFIGALQTNKVKYLRGQVDMIHAVDRLNLARELNKQWRKLDASIDVLIQVNLAGEQSKAGVAPNQVQQMAEQLATLPYVRLRGLMTLPPYAANPEDVRPWFRQLRGLSETLAALRLPGVSMETLSMGMSHDFEVAIEEGATLVRVGTAIFGEREA